MNYETFAMYYGCIGVGLCLFVFMLQGMVETITKCDGHLGYKDAIVMIFTWPLLLAMLLGHVIGRILKAV